MLVGGGSYQKALILVAAGCYRNTNPMLQMPNMAILGAACNTPRVGLGLIKTAIGTHQQRAATVLYKPDGLTVNPSQIPQPLMLVGEPD